MLLMKGKLPPIIAPRFEEIVASMNRHYRRLFQAAGGGLRVAIDFVDSLYAATFLAKDALSALEAFVVSFSTHAHDSDIERTHGAANQWRNYASPNGVCLVLDTASMAEHLGQAMDSKYWGRLALAPVRYAEAPVDQLFPELADASAETLRQFIRGVRYPEMAVPEFLSGATLLKDGKFKPEREIRIVAIPGTKRLSDQAEREHPADFKVLPLPEIRTRGDGRRYVPLLEPLAIKLPLKRIIVGPSERQVENADVARSMLSGIPIVLSECRPGNAVE